jgi:uncharacterized protein (DUF1810 family)
MRSTEAQNLSRFLNAQEGVYETALSELRHGQKSSHWMWFIFPQIAGLGRSDTARYYAIKNRQEALNYLQYPLLGARLRECTQAVLSVSDRSLSQIFGYPDDMKFCSCMTLFQEVSDDESIFSQAIEKFCRGQPDIKTQEIIKKSQ